MKNHFINTTTRLACIAGFALTASMANAATISTDFESAIAPAVPSGWTTVGVGANGTFATTAGEGNPGQSGNLDWTGTNQTAPTVYLVNSGVAFDATQSITGSFQFYNEDDGFDTTSNFIIGDVQNGLTNTSAGEFLNVSLAERTFGRRANILCVPNDDRTHPLIESQWRHDPRSRSVVFVFDEGRRRAPRVMSFSDFRVAEEKEDE